MWLAMKIWAFLAKKLDYLHQKVLCLLRKLCEWLESAFKPKVAKSASLKLFENELQEYFSDKIIIRDVVEFILRSLQMPATIIVGGNGAKALFTEYTGLNGSGDVIAPLGPVQYASSDANVATVDSNGNVLAVGAGSCSISAKDTVNGLSASDTLTVQPQVAPPPVAQSATLVLSAN